MKKPETPQSKPQTSPARDERGRLLPGNTANPGGRPAVAGEFRLKARALVDELVLAAWEAEVRSGGEDWLRASELLAAYGYGRPNQSIDLKAEVSTVDPTPPLTNAERRALLKLQLAAENKP